jgi:hypothetical protein
MTHWVLTVNVNDYDQHGDYYVASWDKKPSVEDLVDIPNQSSTSLCMKDAMELFEKGYFSPTPTMGFWGSFELFEVDNKETK